MCIDKTTLFLPYLMPTHKLTCFVYPFSIVVFRNLVSCWHFLLPLFHDFFDHNMTSKSNKQFPVFIGIMVLLSVILLFLIIVWDLLLFFCLSIRMKSVVFLQCHERLYNISFIDCPFFH